MKCGTRSVKFLRRISLITLVPFDLERPDLITQVGEGVFLAVSRASTARGRAPALPNFGGSLLFMRTLFDAKLPSMTYGEGTCFLKEFYIGEVLHR